jgi:elongation factor Ts
MAEISAKTVMKLRKMSGQGMMDCKKALSETDGDIDEALNLLRKKGLATLEKRAGRETSEGKIICVVSDDGKSGALATLCCETDFVAKSDDFSSAADKLVAYMKSCGSDEGAEALAETEVDGKSFAELITEMVSKTGEKTEVGDFTRFKVEGEGVVGTYIHFNNKSGAMVEIETSSPETSAAVAPAAGEVCMHITAMNPVAVDRDNVDSETVEKEKAIAKEQVKGKPENIIDKIIEGKMNKFYSENCLVDQDFVKDDSKTVGQAVSDAAKQAGGTAKIKRFVRFEIGG